MKYLTNKYKETNLLKQVFFVVVGAFVLLFSVREYSNFKRIERLEQSTYAIDKSSGIVVKMNKENYTYDDRLKEYQNHVRMYLKHFFEFDQYNFIQNMKFCQNLMDKQNFEKEINQYRTKNIYEKIQKEDLILQIKIKKLNIKYINNVPTGFFKIINSSRNPRIARVNKRYIEGNFKIRDLSARTDDNIHACEIYDYVITRIEEIK